MWEVLSFALETIHKNDSPAFHSSNNCSAVLIKMIQQLPSLSLTNVINSELKLNIVKQHEKLNCWMDGKALEI